MKYLILLTALILISCKEQITFVPEITEMREINSDMKDMNKLLDSMRVNQRMLSFTLWSHRQTCKAQTEYIHRDSVRSFYGKEIEKLIYGGK